LDEANRNFTKNNESLGQELLNIQQKLIDSESLKLKFEYD